MAHSLILYTTGMAMQYESELLRRGETFRADFAKESPNHPDLEFIDADIAARKTRIDLLKREQSVASEQPFFEIPENLVTRFTREIGGKSAEQLEAEAKAVRKVSEYASSMIYNPKFEVLEEVTQQELGKLQVSALGLIFTLTTRQIFERIPQCRVGEYALELCRAEVGPHQAIADKDQPLGDFYFIMHEPITDRDGGPHVFGLGRGESGLWLNSSWAGPAYGWIPEFQLVVALRKIEPVKS